MLKKLEHKFVFTNMLLVFMVIAVVFGAVCMVNYNQRVSDVQAAVNRAAQNDIFDHVGGRQAVLFGSLGDGSEDGAVIPEGLDTGTVAGPDGSQDAAAPSGTDEAPAAVDQVGPAQSGEGGNVPDDGEFKQGQPRMSSGDQFVATSVYALSEAGVVSAAINDSLGLEDNVLAQGVARAWQESVQGQKVSGHIGELNLYYCVNRQGDQVTVAFASGNYVDQNMMSLMLTLGGVCVLALIAFFGISVWLSRWALRPVERAWVQQQQFVADASHELKTPLTVILANNSIIEAQQQSTVADQMKWIESTRTEAQLMQGLVNDLLYLAKPEDGEQQLQMGTVNFSDVVQNVALQFESVAFERGVQLNDDVAPDITVRGDQARLSRMVSTLVDNACKYVDKGGQVDVGLESAGSHVFLTVHNTGEAIDAQDIPHLFDRFWRADKARTRGAGGFGLGLAIAQEIAADHEGSIRVTSSNEQGTTFTVML